ncbi:PREDICTED: protein CROWDED NUCLEI 4 [Nelumbo nucifera]|uniref:Protein CROWDED NUCLEI 4 n=2 Tax=Nelumbo nucifera TaxID=4432 RepID=A0A1U7Z4Y2_NELNU|nr:PREDICTED: protein CROWDED NUCLEI 4 [Nelumbo nucifera]DAD48249.1 TPA_asm: hypothetical protein HUJ06_018186 [Nelumbo nucifera]
MVSPQQERLGITLSSSKAGSPASRVLEASTPVQRNNGSPLGDETIWRRLREAGFDEESIKRRDKAALIAYIAKLEAEIFDYQHHMGLLILERKDWTSKYETIKETVESLEILRKRDQAAHSSALAEAAKREESLKKALGVEKECIANIEKALHEMRMESAETKVAAESKMAEARSMVEAAQKKFADAEVKLHEAESLQAEARRYHHAAERKLQEVEAREDELRRRLVSFKSDCEAKEKEINLERQAVHEGQKILQQGQERLLDGQTLLNQREDYIFGRVQELNQLEKELEASKEMIEKQSVSLNEEKSNLDLKVVALSTREEAVIQREMLLAKKEQELLVLQEKIASKEHDEIQRLNAEHESVLEKRKSEFEAELEVKRKLLEEEMENKRRAYELREVDLNHREELLQEKEQDLEALSRALLEKERETKEKLKLLEEKEKSLIASEKEADLEKIHLQKEREEINNMKLDINKSMDALENKRKRVHEEEEKLAAMKTEREELLVLEMKLTEEIVSIRTEKLQLVAESDQLKAEKAKFETEWELIDEKREELQREAERVAEERKTVLKFLKDERDSLKLEKDVLRDQLKHDAESLSHEREAFISKMEHEHSEWFSKIQQERADFMLDIEMQKKELDRCIDKRREEIESYLREKEEAFEQEKTKELQRISFLQEKIAKEMENVALEMKRLDAERIEINMDRDRRENEWAELRNSIEELQIQREKLKRQRELLRADREEIDAQIEHLKKLEDLKIVSENIVLSEMQGDLKPGRAKGAAKKLPNLEKALKDSNLDSHPYEGTAHDGLHLDSKQGPGGASPPSSTPFSWIKRCAELIFKHSPEKLIKYGERLEFESANVNLSESKDSQNSRKCESVLLENVGNTSGTFERQRCNENDGAVKAFTETQPEKSVFEEPKIILEVPATENLEDRHSLDLEPEPKSDATEKSVYSSSEKGLLAGRKRLKNTSNNNHADVQSEQSLSNKKKRQRKNVSETPKEGSVNNCMVSTQQYSPGDGPDFEIAGDAEETSSFVDKNCKIPEGIIENKVSHNYIEHAKLTCSLNKSVNLDDVQGRGTGYANSPQVGNAVSSRRSKVQK